MSTAAQTARDFLRTHGGDDVDLLLQRLGPHLGEPDTLGALAEHYDCLTPVTKLVASRAPEVRVAALVPLLSTEPPMRKTALGLLRALLGRTLQRAPSLLEGLDDAARALGQHLLAERGLDLPAYPGWTSPWAERAPRRRAVPPEPVPVRWVERVLDEAPRVADHPERDASLTRQFERFPDLYWLGDMGETAALALWKRLDPTTVGCEPRTFERLVARFGAAGLDTALALAARHPSLVPGLWAADAPRVASLMAAAFAGRPAQAGPARDWLERFPQAATVGLAVPLFSRQKQRAARARAALGHVRQAQPGGFAEGLGRFPPDFAAAVVDELRRPHELPRRPPTLPAFLEPDELPRPRTADGQALTSEDLRELLWLLKATPLEGASWVAEATDAFTPASLAQLAFALFERWLAAQAPPKEKWMVYALAHFGDEATANELYALAKDWAPRGLSARAQLLVEVLGQLGTGHALRLVHALARKVTSRAFRTRAEQVFAAAAERLGLSGDELAERLVPDLGLSVEGALQVEPKVFLCVEGGAVLLRDAVGRELEAPPKLPLGASPAALKKKAAEVVRETAARLERRMVWGTRVDRDHFVEVYLMNGLLRRVAEQVAWGVYEEGALRATFTVGPMGPVDSAGRPVELRTGCEVGVVHALELSSFELAAWCARFPEEQPFPQLHRDVERVEPSGLLEALGRYRGRGVSTAGVLRLERLGWRRGKVEDGGCYVELAGAFPCAAAAVTFEPGVYAQDPMAHPAQVLREVTAVLGPSATAVGLGELLRDLRTAFGRADA